MRRVAARAFTPVSARKYASVAPPKDTLMPGIKLLVCDMAGTTVNEQGLVYTTLRMCMCDAGLSVSEADMCPWHGAGKSEVVAHFADREGASASAIHELEAKINAQFEERLLASYMAEDSPLSLIDPTLPEYFNGLRAKGVKVGLNTGYPKVLQAALLKKLRMEEFIDGYCSAQEVVSARPSPYMVHLLMSRLRIEDCRTVAKCGDTERDMGEGLNAGCGQVIGVLSGADTTEQLLKAGAHTIAENITRLPMAS